MWRWYVDFESGPDGWVAEDFLKKSGSATQPTITLTASPTSITAGESSTLTWSSTNATTCTASDGWTGTQAISGKQPVTPTQTTTYTLTCTGTGGTATQSATVTVIPLSTAFKIGDPVEVTENNVNVWNAANGTILGTQSAGVRGTVTGVPTYAGGHWWWLVDFESGADGWVAEDFLKKSGSASPTHPLNDTGITRCGDGTSNNLPCPVAGFPGQDAEYGRDVTHNDDSDGHAGFSFTKLDENGKDLPASATNWSCVRDNVTGLIWEVKTDDGGLRDADNYYSWYNPDPKTNGGNAGTQNGGRCSGGIACDTYSFVQAVNAQGLCGANDWRLPDVRELLSIVSSDRYNSSIDTDFFHARLFAFEAYWSSSPNAEVSDNAWFVDFYNGAPLDTLEKNNIEIVRLVRGGY